MAPSADPAEARIGTQVGAYRLRRELGRGSAGVVYEASDPASGQRAAVKLLSRELSQDRQHLRRFFDEARAAGSTPHSGLLRYFDFGQLPDGTAYLVMEYLEGDSLRQRLDLHPSGMPAADALALTAQLAGALAALHEQGIAHRDLKPENVMLVPGPAGEQAKILDFGMAKFLNVAVRRTAAGTVMGTPKYMSPEQCVGSENLDARTDVYSLGVVLYEMLAGRPPFPDVPGRSPMAMLMAHLQDEPPPLGEVAPQVPAEVAALVGQMLAKDPAARPLMAQVAARTQSPAGGAAPAALVPAAPAALAPAPAGALSSRQRSLIVVGSALLGLLVAAILWRVLG